MVEMRKTEDFMQPVAADPLRKREQFAVSLRNKKRKEILENKRKRFPAMKAPARANTADLSLDH